MEGERKGEKYPKEDLSFFFAIGFRFQAERRKGEGGREESIIPSLLRRGLAREGLRGEMAAAEEEEEILTALSRRGGELKDAQNWRGQRIRQTFSFLYSLIWRK